MTARRLGVGPKCPRAILIGEAFGEQEEEQGEPFVGRAGSVLNSLLTQAGLPREECYVTNLLNARPSPGSNDISPLFRNGALTSLGQAHQRALLDELVAIDCKLVFPLGNVALAAICGAEFVASVRTAAEDAAYEAPEGITKWRGSPLASPLLPGRLVLPTLHPSYIARGAWAEAWLVTRDFAKGLRIAAEGARKYSVHVAQSADEALSIIARASAQPLVCSDIETPDQQLECFCLCWQEQVSYVIPIGRRWAASDRRKIISAYRTLLEAPVGPTLLWQNGNYDTFWLERFEGIRACLPRCEDSMYLFSCLYPELKKKLAVLNSLYTDLPFYKDDYEESKRLADLALLYDYNGKDGIAPLAAWNELSLHSERGAIEHTYRQLTMANLPAAQAMQRTGFAVDHAAWRELRARAELEIAPLQGHLDELTQRWREAQRLDAEGKLAIANALARVEKELLAEARADAKRLDAKAPVRHLLSSALLKQLNAQRAMARADAAYWSQGFGAKSNMVAAYFEARGERPGSWDKTRLKELAKPLARRDLYPEARLILDIRERRTQIDTFLKAKLDPEDLRYRFSVNVRGTKYGRLSGSKLFFRYGGNPFNLPQSFRTVFIADKAQGDFIPFFANLDQSKAEYAHVANLSGDENMLAALAEGKDVHAWTAHLLLGVKLDFIEAEAKLLGESTSSSIIAEARKQLSTQWHGPEFDAAFALVPDSSLRQFGKKRNHAWNYRESAEGYAQRTGTSIKRAREQDALQRKAFPAVVTYWESTRWEVLNRKQLTNCFNRVIPFRSFFTTEVWKSACAARPQSGVADVNNAAMREIHAWGDAECSVRNNVYDSLLLQLRLRRNVRIAGDSGPLIGEAERINALLTRCVEVMSPELSYADRKFRVGIDVKLGRCWGKMEKVNLAQSATTLLPLLQKISQGEL